MSKNITLPTGLVLTIGILVGGLVFSHFNASTQPLTHSQPNYNMATSSAQDRPIHSLRDLNNAFVDIADEVNPTVVTVFTEKVTKVTWTRHPFFDDLFDDFFFGPRGQQPNQNRDREQEYRQQGLGSGVIVSSDGYILTNNHVVSDADTINIRLQDEKTYPAKVVGTDPKTDIAVLKIDTENPLPAIRLGDSDDLRVGEMVLAIGSPMSANLAHTVTSGIVSAKGRSNVGLADYEDFIQTDAAINPGNSGGALVNLDGELIGINTAIATKTGGFQGIGFAVPVNMARYIMESLLEHGAVVRGWIGVQIQSVDESLARAMDLPEASGSLVNDVVEDSPAEQAGLEVGDVIIALNDEKMSDVNTLRNTVAATMPGREVKLTIIRDGVEKTVPLTLGELEAEATRNESSEQISDLLGFTVGELTAERAQTYDVDRSDEGVLVIAIDPAGNAYRAGLREGDLIYALDRKDVNNLSDFNQLAKSLKKGETILLQVQRRGGSMFIAFTL